MNREEIANKLVVSVFVTLFFLGAASIYISQAASQGSIDSVAPASNVTSPATIVKNGNIAAGTFFTAGAVLALLVTIMLGLQLKKARRA